MRHLKVSLILLALAISSALVIVALRGPDRPGRVVDSTSATAVEAGDSASNAAEPKDEEEAEEKDEVEPTSADEANAKPTEEAEPPKTPEEQQSEAEEKLVEEFEALTDSWSEPSTNGVSMKDVEGFVKAFRGLPKDRRDESIHRAINLIPDENVMLLAGVLMDPEMDKETVEAVFADVLNRDEAMKDVILKRVLENKNHPCYKDAEWLTSGE